MKIFNTYLLCFVLFVSCNKQSELRVTSKITENNTKTKTLKNLKIKDSVNLKNECAFDSIEMLTSEFKEIKFYTENILRGKGVVELSINKKVDILNVDKTLYGSIILQNGNEENPYEIKLPRTVIAREIIPNIEFQVFSFDAEFPETDKNFLIVYINHEKKLIEKNKIKYSFSSWDKYIKSAFIQLSSNITNVSIDEQKYWYNVLQIKDDSMQIKSVAKTSCDYIEDFKNTTKWIKWKNDNCKLIKFNFCY